MTKTTFTEFRKHAKAYFDSVEQGETVRVIRHGKVIAEIVPPHENLNQKAWKKPGLKLLIPGASLTKAILLERREK
ncbi:MAG TPA: type II toxin-antitoxin system Phd/YefM family antitoxin [Candidatus Omnitrophota bacterium]|nr:type II toxin-antitoxin system Phd/YefM family antitoxin [Candidatus Omnitrophota bacterium]